MNREMESGPGGENNQPSSEAPITVIDWQTAALQVGRLRPGDLVGGFPDVTKLNLFTYNVGQFLKNKPLTLNQPNIELSRSGKHSYKGWHKSSMLPSKAITPPNFNGDLEKIAVSILDDELPADPYGKLRKRFVITADTHTTGKKERGKVAVLCLIGIYDKAKE